VGLDRADQHVSDDTENTADIDRYAREPENRSDNFARLERELGVLVRRRLRLLALSGLKDRTVDGTGYAVLRRLDENGPLRLTKLASLLRLDASTVSRQVAGLTAKGLVERHRDPRDGRAYLLAPTEAGYAQLEAARAARCAVLGELLAGWRDDERTLLADLLGRLNADLDTLAPGADAEGAPCAAESDDSDAIGDEFQETA
jgi:DNA-binding MarR family transcriptional regulator